MEVAIRVEPDAHAAAALVARLLVEAVRDGRSIALSGGSTPTRAYELAADAEADWGAASLWLVDERYVPVDDPRSNRRLVEDAILARVSRRPAWHPVPTETASPEEAAVLYEAALRREGVPEIVFLGLGSDGHTASLFPGLPALDERERLAVATEAGLEPFVPRITLTLPAIAAASRVVYLVTGEDKADRVAAAFAGEPTPAVPGSLARSADGTTTVVLDHAAAGSL